METRNQYLTERESMVSKQIKRRGITNPRLLDVFVEIPRHYFIPQELHSMAYDDCPLPIGSGQTISQPYIVALMTSLLTLEGNENVLEIGTGSGYQAAILSRLAQTVHTVERHAELAKKAKKVLQSLQCHNVHVHVADGSLGWQEAAPFHAILVTAAAPQPPQPLFEQLEEGGRLVLPVGEHYPSQDLQRWTRIGDRFEKESLIPVAFVPLRGKYGWGENEWD